MISAPKTCELSRRQFCALGAGAIAAATATYPSEIRAERTKNQPVPFGLNYIVASPLYGTAALEDVLEEVGKTGAKAIDIWSRPHTNHREQLNERGFEEMERHLERHALQLKVFTRYDLGPYRLEEEMRVLERFGGELLVCGAAPSTGGTWKEQIRRFVDSLAHHAEKAEKHGLAIGIENHSKTILNSVDSIRYFAEYNALPNVGLAMAPYHLPQDPEVIAGLIEDLGDTIVLFQAWEHGMGCMEKRPKDEEMMQMPGLGKLDFAPLLAALKKIDYQGPTEVFMHPVPRGVAIRETLADVTAEIIRSHQYLERCLAKVA